MGKGCNIYLTISHGCHVDVTYVTRWARNVTTWCYLFGKLVFLAEWFNSPNKGEWFNPYNFKISEEDNNAPRTAQDALYTMRCMVVVPWARVHDNVRHSAK